jgi:hypothetical protein
MVAFGGIAGGLGPLPVFEFVRSLSEVGAKVAFFKDDQQAWYHRGVVGVGPNVDSIADHIRELANGVDEIVTIGNSAGGYASLLFASLLGCEAHAFSPQTFIDPDLRSRHSDDRWEKQIGPLVLEGHLDDRFADLRPVVSAGRGPFHIYYAAHHDYDRIHAEHLAEIESVTLHSIDSQDHTPIRHLRDTGWLRTFLEELAHRPLPGSPDQKQS